MSSIDINEFSEQKAETLIGKLVQVLVISAAGIVFIGGALYLKGHGSLSPSYHLFQGEPWSLRSLQGIITGARSFNSLGLMQLGILFLIAIPLIRVVAFFISFLLRRDWLYSEITLVVLGILLFSLAGMGKR